MTVLTTKLPAERQGWSRNQIALSLLLAAVVLAVLRPVLPEWIIRLPLPEGWVTGLAQTLDTGFNFIKDDLGLIYVTRSLSGGLEYLLDATANILYGKRRWPWIGPVPWAPVAAAAAVLGYWLGGWKMAALAGGTFVWTALIGQWKLVMQTMSVLVIAAPVAFFFGLLFGITPLGLGALVMLRIEGGLIFAGSEFDDTTDPFEAGIGFTVPLKTQEDDFIGRTAIEERKAHPHRKLVGFEVEGGTVPSPGDCVRMGKAQVGEITSAMKSPVLGKVIALGRIAVAHAEPGTEIEIGQLDGQQKRLKAMVTKFPHFDPTKERVKSNYT